MIHRLTSPSRWLVLAVMLNAVAAGDVRAQQEVTVGRYVFAGVGIDEYQDPSVWRWLDNAVNDVTRVRETLVGMFDFESPDEWILTDAEATQRAIRELIDDLRVNLQSDDNLIFFYAGHVPSYATLWAGRRWDAGATSYQWA